jgi:hypothetical protein
MTDYTSPGILLGARINGRVVGKCGIKRLYLLLSDGTQAWVVPDGDCVRITDVEPQTSDWMERK